MSLASSVVQRRMHNDTENLDAVTADGTMLLDPVFA